MKPALTLGCVIALTFAAHPAAAQSTWFGAKQTAAVNDPKATACISLALGNHDPPFDFSQNLLEGAAARFDMPAVEDAVAMCRIALRAFPGEPKVIVAHFNAALTFSMLLFGFKDLPLTDEDAVRKARAIAEGTDANRFEKQMAGFFLGSAYEYGVGTAPDPHEAAKWYGMAADAGDKVSERELARLLKDSAGAQ